MSTLYIVRGISGSGKTTYAKELAEFKHCSYYEADMFFTNKDGEYKFDEKLLPRAHQWCQREVFKEIDQGKTVIVANTFTRLWEMSDYIQYALMRGYRVVIVECLGQYQNVHGVSNEIVERQKSRFMPNSELVKKYMVMVETGRMIFSQYPL